MEFYVADAFSEARFGGNPAGVAPLGEAPFPDEAFMRSLAAELRHSETAYLRQTGPRSFHLRYFTPTGEVALCGHATVAAFTVLREVSGLAPGEYTALTQAGALCISVERDVVWLDMAPGRLIAELGPEDTAALCEALGLTAADAHAALPACVVSTGLSDILLPVKSLERLQAIRLGREPFMELSRRFDVCGAHVFCLDDPGVSAHCRNFAPLYGIDEECATGTANGALTYYLLQKGVLSPGAEQRFVQGEAMGRRSVVLSRTDENGRIRIGGSGAICFKGTLL